MSILDDLKAQIAELQRRIALIESYKEGDKWQSMACGDYRWYDCEGEPIWYFDQFAYRKKPEPAVLYSNEHGFGFFGVYDTPEEAQQLAIPGVVRIGVKFVEAVE